MAKIDPINFSFSTGETFTVREAQTKDAQALLDYTKKILSESSYLLTSAEEFTTTLETQRKWLATIIHDAGKLAVLAEYNGSVIGFLDFHNGNRKRNKHQGSFGMSVKQEFRNKGVGKALLSVLLNWAEGNPAIEKICLEVFSENGPAIGLYKQMGFEMEGIRRKAIKTETGYHNLFLMAKFL